MREKLPKAESEEEPETTKDETNQTAETKTDN
jgi:hypothetical protein